MGNFGNFIVVSLAVLIAAVITVPPHVYQHLDALSGLNLIDQAERFAVTMFEENKIPDVLARKGIQYALHERLHERHLDAGRHGSEQESEYVANFVADLKSRGIAEQTKAANEQHYEVPTDFYNLVLGGRRKYSCALYPEDTPREQASELLDAAEIRMLQLYAERAQITKGKKLRVMDLGCGWGSVSLWFAENFPDAEFVGVSNSNTQREYITATAKARGLTNIKVLTADITTFELPAEEEQFDRVISIEMFEHMKNYELLLAKVSRFLKPKGLLFVHIFVHDTYPYHFLVDENDPQDWMARYFFSGGTMPSDDLLLHFQQDVSLVRKWRVNGEHYSLTSEAWLQNMDQHEAEIRPILAKTYGAENETLWFVRWRAFFLACSELFHMHDGTEWYVSHYLFENK